MSSAGDAISCLPRFVSVDMKVQRRMLLVRNRESFFCFNITAQNKKPDEEAEADPEGMLFSPSVL